MRADVSIRAVMLIIEVVDLGEDRAGMLPPLSRGGEMFFASKVGMRMIVWQQQ